MGGWIEGRAKASTDCGDRVDVDLLKGGRMRYQAKPGKSVTTIFGMLEKPGTPRRSIEELNETAAAGWAGEV